MQRFLRGCFCSAARVAGHVIIRDGGGEQGGTGEGERGGPEETPIRGRGFRNATPRTR